MPEVKWFIFHDLPLFHNTEFKQISGANPELIFLNRMGEEIERISLKDKNRIECRNMLLNKGFYMKQSEDEGIPEEFRDAPYNSPHSEL